MQTLMTHQQHVEAAIRNRTQAILDAASPQTAGKISNLREKSSELSEQAEAVFQDKASAMRQIESLTMRQSVILFDIENLNGLKAVAGAREQNAKQALEYYLTGQTNDGGFAIRNWTALTDHMLRTSIVAEFIPGSIKGREAELQFNRAEVAAIAEAHTIDVPALLAALRKRATLHEAVCYVRSTTTA